MTSTEEESTSKLYFAIETLKLKHPKDGEGIHKQLFELTEIGQCPVCMLTRNSYIKQTLHQEVEALYLTNDYKAPSYVRGEAERKKEWNASMAMPAVDIVCTNCGKEDKIAYGQVHGPVYQAVDVQNWQCPECWYKGYEAAEEKTAATTTVIPKIISNTKS